jgi:hypothetical protein
MFGWREKNADALEAELREATLKHLAEVLGLRLEDFESGQAPSEKAPEMKTEPEFGARPRSCDYATPA